MLKKNLFYYLLTLNCFGITSPNQNSPLTVLGDEMEYIPDKSLCIVKSVENNFVKAFRIDGNTKHIIIAKEFVVTSNNDKSQDEKTKQAIKQIDAKGMVKYERYESNQLKFSLKTDLCTYKASKNNIDDIVFCNGNIELFDGRNRVSGDEGEVHLKTKIYKIRSKTNNKVKALIYPPEKKINSSKS